MVARVSDPHLTGTLPEEHALLTEAETRAAASTCHLGTVLHVFSREHKQRSPPPTLPQISAARLSGDNSSIASSTKLYLAYGSNLCYETFQGRRGIRPLAHVNVVVPSLRMTFDLAGVPYLEPCFANSALRHPLENEDYHKDRWYKGMVGVVYEVTDEDYAHVIATEGGGASYKDVLVECFPLALGEDQVPLWPKTSAFSAHTLFAPLPPPNDPEHGGRGRGGRTQRPDPSYAQPSARYLKLITDGAEENELPKEYRDYLYGIRPYEARTARTRMGVFIFEMLWLPFFMFLVQLSQRTQDKDGKVPAWVAALGAALFNAMWSGYDHVFKPVFGDGERTDYRKKGEESDAKAWRKRLDREKVDGWNEKA